MNEIEIHKIQTPVGEMLIGTIDNSCCLLDFKMRKSSEKLLNNLKSLRKATFVERVNALHVQVESELNEYFNRERETFEFDVSFTGTEFQKRVWNELRNIPYGKTISYLQLAKRIGDQKAVRAVAQANGKNILAIVIPCHRVIASNGKLQGYGGGLNVKKKLLRLEDQTKYQSEYVLKQLEDL